MCSRSLRGVRKCTQRQRRRERDRRTLLLLALLLRRDLSSVLFLRLVHVHLILLLRLLLHCGCGEGELDDLLTGAEFGGVFQFPKMGWIFWREFAEVLQYPLVR